MQSLLNAETRSFGEIIKGDNTFKVPIFQRDYSWEEEHWEDLWLDILSGMSSITKHYMGSIVLINKRKKTFEVIDGQQRLTTLTLMILAAIKNLKDLVDEGIDVEKNNERIKILMNDFIGTKSLQSLNVTNKLILNEINEPYFSTYLIQFRPTNNPRSLIYSDRLLYKCYLYYEKKIKDEILGENKIIDNLVDLVEYISDNLVFVQITATDELSAYLIFETLNDRGLDLSVTDLLKNYLFSLVHERDQKHVKNFWNEILKSIDYNDFPKFLRHFWLSENKIVLEKDLFKTIKRNVNSSKKAFALLEKLQSVAPIYAALNNEHDQIWIGNEKAKKHIAEITLFKVKQCYPLMLVSYQKMNEQEWVKVFRMCSVISFRYNIISGLNPNALEEAYNKASLGVAKEKYTTARQVFEALKSVYVEDSTFQENFSKKNLPTKRANKLVRYIMYSIENHLNSTKLDYLSDNGTIEHILPENPDSIWDSKFEKENQKDHIYRLGNYTLLEENINRNVGRKDFDEKLSEYIKSNYKITKEIRATEWNKDSINDRQKFLSKQAVAIWKIDY